MAATTTPPGLRGISRRTLLASGASALALAACSGNSGDGDASPTATTASGQATPTGSATAAPDIQASALAAAGVPDAAVTLAPQLTWPELIVARDQYVQFVVTDQGEDAGALVTTPVSVTLVDQGGQVVAGPMDSTWYPDDRLPTGGLQSVLVSVPDTGVLDMVVATSDGTAAGTAAVQAIESLDSIAPGPGEVIPATVTPTTQDPMDMEDLCTREPECRLHDRTLEAALATGPTVLCIATPAFCTSAICGPVLDDVLAVADSGEHPDVAFVHVEPFIDAGVTLSPIMEELALPSEPWTFVLAADGTILHRFPGPVLPDVLHEVLTGALT